MREKKLSIFELISGYWAVYTSNVFGSIAYAVKLLKVKLRIKSDFNTRYFALSNRTGMLWVMNCGKETFLHSSQIKKARYETGQEQRHVHGHGQRIYAYYYIFLDLVTDTCPIQLIYSSEPEALLWKSRIDKVLSVTRQLT